MNSGSIKKLIENLDRPYVMVLIGPPLSGKTTFLKEVLEPGTFRHISSDEMLKSMDTVGDGDYDRAWREADWKQVNKKVKIDMRQANNLKENAVIDFTNMRSKRRISNLSFWDKDYYKIAVIFPILDKEEYRRRNTKRNTEEKKFISDKVMTEMIESFQPIDKKFEKFDKIIRLQ
jgi:predicted kinase